MIPLPHFLSSQGPDPGAPQSINDLGIRGPDWLNAGTACLPMPDCPGRFVLAQLCSQPACGSDPLSGLICHTERPGDSESFPKNAIYSTQAVMSSLPPYLLHCAGSGQAAFEYFIMNRECLIHSVINNIRLCIVQIYSHIFDTLSVCKFNK